MTFLVNCGPAMQAGVSATNDVLAGLAQGGFDVSEPTVSRWLRRVRKTPDPAQRWLSFLRNHREAIVAMDFFTVPALTLGVLCFFHQRARPAQNSLLRRHAESHNPWINQQTREAWLYMPADRFLLFDRDAKFGSNVVSFARLGKPTYPHAFRSAWQNGIAERWVGSCRGDVLDHGIVLNERHLKRLLAEYLRYYHEDRTHAGLAKDTPAGWSVLRRHAAGSKIRSFPRFAGLHHRYLNPRTLQAGHLRVSSTTKGTRQDSSTLQPSEGQFKGPTHHIARVACVRNRLDVWMNHR